MSLPTTMYPYFAYRDGREALGWLDDAFGFTKTVEVPGPEGEIMHAEMTFGDAGIMLCTAGPEQGEGAPPRMPPGVGIYVNVEDVDAHCERAKAAGATVVTPPFDTEWGARQYRVLDLDGFEWTFGTYRPGG